MLFVREVLLLRHMRQNMVAGRTRRWRVMRRGHDVATPTDTPRHVNTLLERLHHAESYATSRLRDGQTYNVYHECTEACLTCRREQAR